MPAHDIIDNRSATLSDTIRTMLGSTERAKFAVGYFFLSGFEAIGDKLADVKEVRLLIGNTTNQATIEQLAEGYRRLELVERAREQQQYHSDTALHARARLKQIVTETVENARDALALMDQTDENVALVQTVARMIEEKRLKVRLYTKGRLHAKAYIFDYVEDGRYEKGIAVVGSSNLTLSGVTHNTELNVVVHGNENHAELTRWFNELWEDSRDFDATLMEEIKQSWALKLATPYDIYMKTLYTLLRDRLEGGEEKDFLWTNEVTEKLADFQKVAVRQVIQMIRDYGGAFAADVVGTGKSFIGAAAVKHFSTTERAKPLVVCPATLVEMWERYDAVYSLNAQVLSMGMLEEGEDGRNILLDDDRYNDRTFVLVDESHNFRHHTTQRYKLLQAFLDSGRRKVLFLTATPRSKSAWDVYHQIKLFHPEDKTDLPIAPPDLKAYFKEIQAKLDAGVREEGQERFRHLLQHLLVRRTRHHILKWYGFDSETNQPVDPSRFEDYASRRRKAYIIINNRHQYFPRRELETIEYSIEKTYQGLYQQIRGYLGRPGSRSGSGPESGELTYARYGLWHYVVEAKKNRPPYNDLHRAGRNLRGLIRTMLFKRFESSVYAFRETVRRILRMHELFLEALERGIVPAGDDAQHLLYESDKMDEEDLFDALTEASGKYKVEGFCVDRLSKDIESDVRLLKQMLELVSEKRIPPKKDAKLQTLLTRLKRKPLSNGKVLIFSQFADTARYLYENLNPGDADPVIENIYGHEKSKLSIVGRFAPRANPEYKFKRGEVEINLLVATDVLAEGLNLQDGDKVINYDLHWNPVRLIQRFGRIDRIGSEHEVIWGFNFLPETELEKNLGLREKLHHRIQEIHDTIGEDAVILDKTEQLNEEAMYAIYEKKYGQLTLWQDQEDTVDLNEAEEMLRQLRSDDPTEFERIANLRDGIRSAVAGREKGHYVFCQADRYQQLFLADTDGNIVTRDVPRILGTIKCSPQEPTAPLPAQHNSVVTKIKSVFDEEVKHREAERQYSTSLTQGQQYVIRELKLEFRKAGDEDLKGQINTLEKAFRLCKRPAVLAELNRLRRNGVVGDALVQELSNIYYRHSLKDMVDRRSMGVEDVVIPRIVCSEGMT